MKYIIYTEIWEDSGVERWYYGTYVDRTIANEIARLQNVERGSNYPVCSCVIPADKAKEFNIKNLPEELK